MAKTAVTFAPQQEDALKAIRAWYKAKGGPQVFYLGGYAGTGKTTLAMEAAGMAKGGKVRFGAFTGKAALVMRQKGCDGASTIHQLIYRLDDDTGGVPTWKINHSGPMEDASLVVVDECSMVGKEIGNDLLSFGKKVLVLGDPAQLPPVKDAGFFTAREPDFMLTEVHRQARENPIIAMSMKVRMGERLEPGEWGSSRVMRGRPSAADVMAADQVIVGKNLTRHIHNNRIRELKGFTTPGVPAKGDRLICLKNRHGQGLLNGSMWTAEEVKSRPDRAFRLRVSSLDYGPEAPHQEVHVPHEFFTGKEVDVPLDVRRTMDEMTFGYTITCHKAQGSQWPNVFIFDESYVFREDRAKHLYTAITRAAERVTVVL